MTVITTRSLQTDANQSQTQRQTYIPEIDSLRALAVLSVMAYHLRASLLPGGFVGVDVFFVISGYVVSGSIIRDTGRSFTSMLLHFYARRVVRILPALIACLLICSLLSVLFVPPSWLGSNLRDTARAAYFGMSNVALRNADGYFEPRADFNVFTHTWSLAVEEQFYCVFPLLLFIWQRLRKRAGLAGWGAKLLVPSVAAASFVLLVGAAPGPASFYLLPYRFWEIAAGALLVQVQTDTGLLSSLGSLTRTILLAAGLFIVAAACIVADPSRFPYPYAVLPVLGTGLALAAMTSGPRLETWLAKVLRRRFVTGIGRLSYSLYLWHWCVFVLLRWTWGLETTAQQGTALALTFGMAGLSYHGVERPTREAGWGRRLPKLAIVLIGIAAASMAREATKQVFRTQDRLYLGIVRQNGPLWFPKIVKGIDGPGQCPVAVRSRALGTGAAEELHRVCGAPAPVQHHLFILGDSHALAYRTMASMIARNADVEVTTYDAVGCPVVNLLAPATLACAAFIDAALTDIKGRAQPGDAILLASLRAIRTSEQWGPVSPAEMAARRADAARDVTRREALHDAKRIVSALSQVAGLHLIFEAPKPVFPAPVFRCVDWFNAPNAACRNGLDIARQAVLQDRSFVMTQLAALQGEYPSLVVWDPIDTLCPGDICHAMTKDGPLYVDGDHLSAHANSLLYPGFTALLRQFWPDTPL